MSASNAAAVEFRVLGPVEATRNGVPLSLGGDRQRALLALLLLDPGQPISAERLIDEVWSGEPPAGAETTLRSYVSRLRRALGEDVEIATVASGYVLDVAPEAVDAFRFRRLQREGAEALERGAVQRAAERLREALSLWRGQPFGPLADDGALRLEAEQLEELRLRAAEERVEAELRLGKSAELVEELEALVQSQPYRERLWRQLMLALYRAGRQADALAAYRRAHTLLAHELGVEPGEELRELEQEILRQEVEPALPPEERHNLPAPMTSFVGREAELVEIERLFRDTRLLTLTGVGGAGKTRLALEFGRRALADLPDGVWLIDLSAVEDPALATREAAAALEVREQSELGLERQLAVHLRDEECLLVLDNCEHVREAAAELAASLLSSCPRLKVLATSREPLGTPGEVDYPTPLLSLPKPGADARELRGSEAVRLFVARAQSARPQLSDSEASLATAARICWDLDGLPLAIELAAARAKALSLDEIATRLRDRFRFLVSWRRLASARHRTLREAMDWSYELLSADEQSLLASLSVFSGGFTLDAVASVCLEEDDERALERVERLVDASLVAIEHRDDATRYRLLETVRQYAAERLSAADDTAAARARHAQWCMALADEAESQLTGDQQTRWLRILDSERENFTAALTFLAGTGEYERRLRLTVALSRFWYVRGYLAEGRQRLREALADVDVRDPLLLRRALTAAASLALLQGDYVEAIEYAERALAAARAGGDRVYVANALSNLGAITLAAGEHERAAELLEEAVALARAVGDQRIAALAINNLGDLALTVGDYERAEPLFEESLELLRARGDTANIARSLFNLGAVALKLARVEDATARLQEGLVFAEQAGDKEDLAWCLEGLAAVAAAEGRSERAALLLGAAGALLDDMGADFKPFERQLHDETRATAVRLSGEAGFAETFRSGASLTIEEAITSANGR